MTLIVGSANSIRSRRLTRGASNGGIVCRRPGPSWHRRLRHEPHLGEGPALQRLEHRDHVLHGRRWSVVTTAREKPGCLVGLDRGS